MTFSKIEYTYNKIKSIPFSKYKGVKRHQATLFCNNCKDIQDYLCTFFSTFLTVFLLLPKLQRKLANVTTLVFLSYLRKYKTRYLSEIILCPVM